jgi:hypothetical protein
VPAQLPFATASSVARSNSMSIDGGICAPFATSRKQHRNPATSQVLMDSSVAILGSCHIGLLFWSFRGTLESILIPRGMQQLQNQGTSLPCTNCNSFDERSGLHERRMMLVESLCKKLVDNQNNKYRLNNAQFVTFYQTCMVKCLFIWAVDADTFPPLSKELSS